ncbi:serine protease [Streptomyces tritici]|uniref:serine protease n=1 Tax=Streptomyces tritici TaxID=2054410 RepID=UPI003AF02B8D
MGRGDRATLVRICDPAGRARGSGFVADDRGTVVTGHETVDGLARVVLDAPGGRSWVARAADVTALPEAGLALIRSEGLGVRPLPVAARDTASIEPGTYVRLPAGGWREARVLGTGPVTYTATEQSHTVDGVLELAIGTDGREALRRSGEAAGGPVLDVATGAVLAVLGTALHGRRRAGGHALPLPRSATGPLGALLRRNAATVPCYGADLNLAGVLELTATGAPPACPGEGPEPVERADCARETAAFPKSDALVLALVGAPGTGRTTELAALCARRARGDEPAPTVWLRGADLRADDTCLADAVARALERAGRIVAASGAAGDPAATGPQDAARLAHEGGRPLLVVLDAPEEMPPALAHRLPGWTRATGEWLRRHAVRLAVGCRPEHWEQTAHRYGGETRTVRLGPLPGPDARLARERHGLADSAVAPEAAAHPLALRLLAEVRAALPADVEGRPGRDEIFTAHLDLMCLRVTVRIAAGRRPVPAGPEVRRLAARVAGQVHEAARRCLGPGQGELDRAAFEALFPWRTGWASAVLTEGLLVPAGPGYRFAHEELADWLQGAHLEVDAALHALVHRYADGDAEPGAAGSHPVPRHRIAPVLEALLLLDRTQGPTALAGRLGALVDAAERLGETGADRAAPEGPGGPAGAGAGLAGSGDAWRPAVAGAESVASEDSWGPAGAGTESAASDGLWDPAGAGAAASGHQWDPAGAAAGPVASGDPWDPAARREDARWWARRLLREVLLRVPAVRPYLPVLRRLADAVGTAALAPGPFGPAFWTALRIPEDDRLDLLRRLVPADRPDGPPTARYLDAAAERLVADPRGVQPLLCRWFGDERTGVAAAAQALLYAHRGDAVDDLCEALVATAHPRADELLAGLVEDEPAALCRAVDRWAHDDGRAQRRSAAATYGRLVARRDLAPDDRALLRYAALALLARPGDQGLHAAALGILVLDPVTRARYLPQALAEGAVGLAALLDGLAAEPEPVLDALRERLLGASADDGPVLAALAEVSAPGLARRIAELVLDYARQRPEGAAHVAAFVDRRFEDGPVGRAVLHPLVERLVRDGAEPVRLALAGPLAAPGTGASRHLRGELLDVLLDRLDGAPEPGVLDALLAAAAHAAEQRSEPRTRALVHRVGLLLVRTPEGATRFDQRLVGLAREAPGFAGLVAAWLADAPREWAAVVGPSARRTVETLGSSMPMPTDGRGHGTLRPA